MRQENWLSVSKNLCASSTFLSDYSRQVHIRIGILALVLNPSCPERQIVVVFKVLVASSVGADQRSGLGVAWEYGALAVLSVVMLGAAVLIREAYRCTVAVGKRFG